MKHKKLKQWIVFPTWIIIKIIYSSIISNQYSNELKKISLFNWAKNGTELLYIYSIIYWIFGLCFVFILLNILL